MIIACRKGHRDSVRALLDAKANPDVVDKSGRTALSYAVESGHAEIAGVLLEAKANPNAGISDAPLLLAVRVDNPVMAEVLLRAGANPNQMTECVYVSMNSSGGVPIPAPGVSVSGIESTGRQSLRTRSVSMGRRVKQTPLQAAVLEEYPAMVKLLLQFKGDPHAKSPDGSSLLLGALRFETAAKAFLEAGADPNCKDANGDAALIVASKNGFFDAIEPLLKHGADVYVRGQKGDTALFNVAVTMNLKPIGVLLDHKADVNAANVNGWTPLHAVVWTGNKEVIELLLKRGQT